MGENEQEHQTLADRLRAAGRAFQVEQGKSFICRVLKYLLGLIVLLFLLDVIFHFTANQRLVLLGIFGLLLIVCAAVGWYIAHVQKNRLERIARLLETLDPSLGSKVINILQLEEQTRNPGLPALTRELAKEAVQTYTRELREIDFKRIARFPRLKDDLKKAALAAGVFALVFLCTYKISWLEAARYTDPYGDHPAYSFTQLSIMDPSEHGTKVVYGKSAIVRVGYRGHQPREVFLTFYDPAHPDKKTTVPMFSNGGSGFSQQIENVKSDLIVVAHTKNSHSVSKMRQIGVILTPRIEKVLVQVSPPAYTGLKPEETELKDVRALEGSNVRFRILSNRPLREGLIDLSGTTHSTTPMQRSADNEVAGSLTAENSGRLRLGVSDVAGIASEPFESLLTVTHDLPPEISITRPDRDCYVCIDYNIEAQIDATDDYGIETIRIHRALNGVFSEPQVITYDRITRRASENVSFDLKSLGVKPGDVISIFAEAIDTSPAAHLARSQTVKMTVISEEDYNSFLRQQHDIADAEAKYTDLFNRFQERIDQQQRLSTNAQQLQDRIAKFKKPDKAAQQAANDLMEQQGELNADLNDLADEMENFVRDHPVYDVESGFKDMLSKQAQAIRNSTATNETSLANLGQQQLSQQMMDDFKSASDDQLNRLNGGQQQARQQVSQTFQDLAKMQELLKDFNRFQDLYEKQKEIAEQSKAYDSNAPLKREDQLALRNLASSEKNMEDQLRQLSQKLRNDAKNAEQVFPKAAKSGQELADTIDNKRMPPLANEATKSMLQGNGEQSHQLSNRLKSEMEKLFSESGSQSGEQGQELDNYLKLTRNMNPGNTFQQMAQSHKPGSPSQQQGQGQQGQSGTGESGMARNVGPSNVMGKETQIFEAAGADNSQSGKNVPGKPPGAQPDKPGSMAGVKPVNRNSEAVNAEVPIGQYDDLVDKYFRTITK